MKKIFILLLPFILLSCNNDTSGGHDHGDHDHAHDSDHAEHHFDYTINQNGMEYYIHYHPLVVNESTLIHLYVTDLSTGRPAKDLIASAQFSGVDLESKKTGNEAFGSAKFKFLVKPNRTGFNHLSFSIESVSGQEQVNIGSLMVFANERDALKRVPLKSAGPNDIEFTKEQAWNTGLRVQPVELDSIFDVIHTSGKIQSTFTNEHQVIAPAPGILSFAGNILPGSSVNNGMRMFNISGGSLAENNPMNEFEKAKAKYDLEETNYQRKSKLHESEIISDREMDEARESYLQAKANYERWSLSKGNNGLTVTSTASGFVKQILVNPGEYVETGTALAVITENKRLNMQVDVPHQYYAALNNTLSANFGYNNEVFTLEEYNGTLLSFGKSVDQNQPLIPVLFEIDNKGALLNGAFVEVWLKTNRKSKALTVPNTALLEDFGQYSVMVQKGPETFVQQEVELGANDGVNSEILWGLTEKDVVVTQGAYQVKMASMGGEIPAHGHTH